MKFQADVFKSFYILLLFGMCFFSLPSQAHDGGHSHRATNDKLNRWELKSGEIVYGNFSFLNHSILNLEGYEGQLIKLPFDQLSSSSKKIAERHQKRILQLNGQDFAYERNSDVIPDNNWIYSGLVVSILLLLIGFFLKIGVDTKWITIFSKYAGAFGLCLFILLACKKNSSSIGGVNVIIPRTRLTFLDSAFAPYQPAIGTSSDNTYYYVTSNGLPSHNMMIGITSWQQQVPIPQPYTGSNHWSIPFQPIWADVPLSTRTNFMKGAVAIAVNGIPIFNALNNRGVDSYATGELDQWGGHCGRADDYHYHAAPLHLNQTSSRLPIAFALDGFPVYGGQEPDGSTMQSLDTCHGHSWNSQVYHYHGTATYPYVIGAMRGKVSIDPSTPAPENQILPQAFASPLRPATSPLNGAVITNFVSTGTNAYKLTYRIGAKFGYVEYNWNTSNFYTYKLTDTAGLITTNTYQR